MKPLEAGEEGRRWETPQEPGVKKDRRGSAKPHEGVQGPSGAARRPGSPQ